MVINQGQLSKSQTNGLKRREPRLPGGNPPSRPSLFIDDDEEPNFCIGPERIGRPISENYSQNFSLSGLRDLTERTYDAMRRLDAEVAQDLPFCAFQHHVVTLANATLIDRVGEQGENRLPELTRSLTNHFPPGTTIPSAINEYLTGLSETSTVNGDAVLLNLPARAIPLPEYEDEEGRVIPAGSFGPVDDLGHNVYEDYLCPLISRRRIEANALDAIPEDWQPLPLELLPAIPGVVPTPTRNLLGYGPLEVLTEDAKDTIRDLRFSNDAVLSRICFSSELSLRVSRVLMNLKDKMKMITLSATTSPPSIPAKNMPANTTFVEAEEIGGCLSEQSVKVLSSTTFGSLVTGQSTVFTYHRRRTRRNPGCCYTFNGAALPQWVETRNANFEMLVPFQPTVGIVCFDIINSRYVANAPHGGRIEIIDSFLTRNYIT